MIKLKKKLVEETNKKVTYKGDEYIVKSIDVDDDEIENTFIEIENDNDSKSITLKAFINGNASTKDDYINSLVNQVNKPEEVDNQKQETPKKSEREQAIEDARNDFFAKPKDSKYFKKLEKEIYSSTLSEYEEAYYDEFKKLESSSISKKKRRVGETISNTYPGDVDELIDWLKKAIVNITVESGDFGYNSTKDIVSEFNKRDGTNYEPLLSSSKVGTEYKAWLTNNEDIMKEMPEEVRDWKVKKNIGKLNQYVLGDVYYAQDNALTSNNIVFDLLDTYKFKLGKQKPEEENK